MKEPIIALNYMVWLRILGGLQLDLPKLPAYSRGH